MNISIEKAYLENELRSYSYIVDKVYHYEQIIADSEIAKSGLSSPAPKEISYENASDPYKCKYIDLINSIDYASEQLSHWLQRKKWIDMRLELLESDEYKIIKFRYLMQGKPTVRWIAEVIPCSKNTVINKIASSLDKMLNMCD